MKWALRVLGVVAALIAAIFLIGSSLPKQHTATRAARFHQRPEAIWSAITDYSKFPEWRKGVARVEALPSANGKPSWREFDKYDHAIPYEIIESTPPQYLTTRIADPELPFGGTWTYQLTPQADDGTVLRITENGEVRNVFFRFVARLFIGYTKTMEDYLNALGEKLGEKTTVEY
ncbi:MAG TPA: SRPBCC family protein [Candidatus Acidoferrales bacterium]|nr:SRPBCC family protein [Candidatus Acidoferrales bacterium]